ncbi:hypothetical protein QS306_13745 [Paraburkholderia bonniea]|nr:hypothetical protein [Paraburkholderia bonniea]WJF91838.1 hypothetical protein QS306_13745 [Paraburkholderia bonniea]WJF95157.1 hypothetical protein QS308_13755 [Paraburkholderia bonniea]
MSPESSLHLHLHLHLQPAAPAHHASAPPAQRAIATHRRTTPAPHFCA